MADVAALAGTSGYRAISTFSGCGGSCLGLEMAGFEILWASEFIAAARDVYRANHPGVPVDGRDIRTVDPAEVLDALGLVPGEVDLLEGSPPCSSFSVAGRREEGWGAVSKYSDTKQRTDDLFYEFARFVGGIQPKAFIAENVAGLVHGTAKGYMKRIVAALRACGYRVEARLLDAQWLGVPQRRRRVVFVGVREDLRTTDGDPIVPAFPTPDRWSYSLDDVLDPTTTTIDPETGFNISIERYAIGREWRHLAAGRGSNKYLNLVRANATQPSPSITQTAGSPGAAGVTHPTAPRKYTLLELRRLSGFPDDFVLLGTFQQRWERLGRAVPPIMMRRIGDVVRTDILERVAT